MEELISIIALIFFGLVSIISKIVNTQLQKQKKGQVAKKPQPGSARQKNIQRTAVRPPLKAVQQKMASAANTQETVKPNMMDNKKALIPDEEEDKTTSTNILPGSLTSGIGDKIRATEIGSRRDSMARRIRVNRRFAIISHEILGKPKALQD